MYAGVFSLSSLVYRGSLISVYGIWSRIKNKQRILSTKYPKVMNGLKKNDSKGLDCFMFDMMFHYYLKCDCHIILLTCVYVCLCVMYYVTCTTGCSIAQKHGPQTSLCVKKWCSVVFVIAPVSLPCSYFSLEAETWRRTASLALSAVDKSCFSDIHINVYVIDEETCGNEIK
jgi:hypothetical protein